MTGGKNCAREGCSNKGEYYLVVCVPALIDAQSRHPLRMIFDIPLCRDHCAAAELDDFLLPETRARIRVALMSRSRAMPDFARAWKERGRIGDENWRSFQAAKGVS